MKISVKFHQMQMPLSAIFISIASAVILWELTSPVVASPEIMSRPTRPKVFSSPDELRTYLDQLSNYYAIAGRPRFGKRNLAPWMAKYVSGTSDERPMPLTPNELLQLLSSANSPEK